jgi:DNA-binding NtrC family response regulator
MNKILVVDDEKVIRANFCEILNIEGFSAVEASSGDEALEIYRKERPSAVLLDLKMPGMNGIDTLKEMKEIDPRVPVIIITSYGDVQTAVEAIQLGAHDFMLKPPDFNSLMIRLKKAIERRELEQKIEGLNTKIEVSIENSLGVCGNMKKVIQQIQQVANSDFSVIIQGETGTGKTYIANIIHNLSERAKGPFVTVDIGAIPEPLVESELFGYEKGAFTGAEKKKKGYFEIADHGTIFIDEVQNSSPYIQSKFLRVVEERNIYPVGGTQPTAIDIRIIAATNTDMQLSVKEKKFREDLYFRLCEFMILIPPLRQRIEDLPFLARKFCFEAARELKKQTPEISEEAACLLRDYAWPGNIRELKNVVKRAVLLSGSHEITPEHISFLQTNSPDETLQSPSVKTGAGMSLAEMEKNAIQQVLEMTGGNKTKAASILKIDYTTLLRKIKMYGISL